MGKDVSSDILHSGENRGQVALKFCEMRHGLHRPLKSYNLPEFLGNKKNLGFNLEKSNV